MYGENSIKIAKTYKIIGTLYIITEKIEEAKEYLIRAYKIFEAKGMDKFLKEIEGKLNLLNSTKKENVKDQNYLPRNRKSTSIHTKKGKKRTLKY